MPSSFYIIDGHSQIYRALYARMAELQAPSGEPTKATYVFTQGLLKLLRERKPTYIAMACDCKRELLERRRLYEPYKADREGAPEGFLVQLNRIKQIVEALGIPVIQVNGWEADDIIATLVDCAADIDDVVIVSKDKDLMQLVGPKVRMYDPLRQDWIGPEQVKERWGVPPRKLIEVFSLMGDPGDNIPGIKGIGEVTAAKLVNEYGSVDAVFKQMQAGEDCKLKPSVQKKLMAFMTKERARAFSNKERGQAYLRDLELTRKLVTLNRDVPIRIDTSKLRWRGLDTSKAKPIFKELGFRRWE